LVALLAVALPAQAAVDRGRRRWRFSWCRWRRRSLSQRMLTRRTSSAQATFLVPATQRRPAVRKAQRRSCRTRLRHGHCCFADGRSPQGDRRASGWDHPIRRASPGLWGRCGADDFGDGRYWRLRRCTRSGWSPNATRKPCVEHLPP